MSVEILVNVAARETRAALLDEGTLQEVFIERASRRGLVGNLYKGRVTRVLPGMQAAFLEIGLARTGFLHVADILSPPPDPGNDAPRDERPEVPDIRTLVREGDELLVQVVKDPLGTKGARLSTHVSLPSRYLVYMPVCPRASNPSSCASSCARPSRSSPVRANGPAATSCVPPRWMHRRK
jgi:ribonuclease G